MLGGLALSQPDMRHDSAAQIDPRSLGQARGANLPELASSAVVGVRRATPHSKHESSCECLCLSLAGDGRLQAFKPADVVSIYGFV